MAFLLSSLGGQLLGGLIGSHAHKPANPDPASTTAASSFGNVLGAQINVPGANDPLAQLAALVNSGTPLSSIVDRLSTQLADTIGHGVPASRIKSALSPPGNAPPGTAAQQVAALARRLQAWLSGVARGDQRVGQQSDTSGQVLDANRARELPAQSDPESSSSTLDVSALARSLLASVAASFGPGSVGAATPLATSPAHVIVSAVSEGAKETARQVSNMARLHAVLAAGGLSDATATDAPAATAQSGAQSQSQVQPQPAAPTSDPGDLLARMVMRAVQVDARVNPGAVAQAPTTATTPAFGTQTASAVHPGNGGTTSPLADAATPEQRLTAMLAEAFASGSQSSENGNDGALGRNANPSGPSVTVAPKAAGQSDTLAFAVPTASQPISTAALTQPASTTMGAPVDPTAVIAQLVKAMNVRTQSDGTSEVRLRLVPEQLGAVTMRLTISGSNVSATAVAQNAGVQNALLTHQHQLARSLADSGMKLTSFTVNLAGGDAGNDRNRDRASGFGRHYTVHEVAASNQSDPTESSIEGSAILPHSTLALFNYLA